MDELSTLVWPGAESAEAFRNKIFLTTLEIDSAKTEVDGVKRQCLLNEQSLREKLQIAYRERDQAVMQLQQLIDSLVPPPAATSLMEPGITEYDNVDSYFATGEETENSSHYVEEYSQLQVEEHNSNTSVISPVLFSTGQPRVGHGSRVVENLVSGQILPQRGRLLEAVIEAGATLHDMMVAGPIPQWKNPPPVQKLKIPTILPNSGCGGLMMNNTGATTQRILLPKFSNITQMMSPSLFCGSSGMSGLADMSGGSTYRNPNEQLNIVSKKQLIAMGKRPRII